MKKKILLILAIIVIGIFYYNNVVNRANFGSGNQVEFVIDKGQGVDEIAKNLKNENLISNAFIFKLYVGLNDYRSNFFDGTYNLADNLNIKEIVAVLTQQNVIKKEEQSITFIEGWNVNQMDEYLVKENLIQPNEFIDYVAKVKNADWSFLIDRPKGFDLEGYLYPDTYRIYNNATVDDIATKMLENFDNKLTDEMRQDIKKQHKTIFEVLTLASIVEKEMHGAENRKIVASVFQNRLDIGMALQSDATVNYITKKGTTRPSLDDLAIDDPYNTYKYPGLPPGPICNPSIEAISAVIYPAQTDYFYFLTTPDGEIIFSKTHDEHVQNKYKYYK